MIRTFRQRTPIIDRCAVVTRTVKLSTRFVSSIFFTEKNPSDRKIKKKRKISPGSCKTCYFISDKYMLEFFKSNLPRRTLTQSLIFVNWRRILFNKTITVLPPNMYSDPQICWSLIKTWLFSTYEPDSIYMSLRCETLSLKYAGKV